MARKGYPDYPKRVPPGWRVVTSDKWLINNPDPGQSFAEFDLCKWRFETSGEVDNPLQLKYEEFQNLPHVSRVFDHHCVDGWSYLGQSWNGVDISVIKEMTRVRKSARFAFVESDYALSQRFPIEQDLFLVDGQNSSRLTKALGFPLRVIAPGEFGFKSRKWVSRIRFSSEPELDGLERAFESAGALDIYSEKICNSDPWTVDDNARKKFLRTVFAADTEETRLKKKEDYCGKKVGIYPVTDDAWILLCNLGDLEKLPNGKKFVVNGNEVLVAKFGDTVFAVEPICSHMGSDLSRMPVNYDAQTLKCHLHGAVFGIANGACLAGSYGSDGGAFPEIRTYKIRIENNGVFLQRAQHWGDLW
jgi:DMSO/TMAO reductase YedYZ molybdopterin-dependent catalytic subunit/nitrite reductase/ring-hydroxylating ferredoxin subunit